MPMRARLVPVLLSGLLLVAAALPASAQAPGEGTKFFMEYRAAFAKAKAIEDLVPYLSKARAEKVQQTPKEDRAKMFGLMKAMDAKDLKIVKESTSPTGYVLEVTGKNGASKGTINIVREGGKLKLDRESWKQ
jgi:hypothetical protein